MGTAPLAHIGSSPARTPGSRELRGSAVGGRGTVVRRRPHPRAAWPRKGGREGDRERERQVRKMAWSRRWQMFLVLAVLGDPTAAQHRTPTTLQYGGVQRSCAGVPLSCAPNCGAAITAALHACSEAGGGIVQLVAGVYHLNDSSSWAAHGQQLIRAQDLTDVALVGASTGSRAYNHARADPAATTLLVHGLRGAVTVFRCRRVRFFDLDIDMARLPYTFGYVSAATDDTMTVKFDPTVYPFDAPVQPWTTIVTNVQEFDRGDWRMNASIGGGRLPIAIDSAGQLTLSGLGTSAGIRVGKWYVLRNAYYDACGFAGGNNSDVHIERVTLWAAGGMGFAFSTTRDIEMVDVAVTRRPGLALSATADGTHFDECGGHLHFNRLRVEGQGDDGMNVHGAFHDVRTIDHDSTATLSVTLGNRPAGSATELTELTLGARYEFRNRRTFQVEGIGVLQAHTAVAPPTSRLQTARFLMEAGANVSLYALCSNADLIPSVHIEDSYFGNSKERGALLKSSNTLVERTLFNRTGSTCVEAWPDGCYWFESNGFRNWTLRNNTFLSCVSDSDGPLEAGTSDVFVAACAPPFDNATGKPVDMSHNSNLGHPINNAQPFADGVIDSNHFVQQRDRGKRVALDLHGFDGLLVLNNVVQLTDSPPPSRAAGLLKAPGPPAHSGVGGITGSLDGFSVHSGPGVDPQYASVSGWVYDPLRINASAVSSTVQVELDGRVVASKVANASRPDLTPAGYCGGGDPRAQPCPFGYSIWLPGEAVETLAEGNHTLAIYALRPASSHISQRYLVPMAEAISGLACVTPSRRQCEGVSCWCAAPPPPPPGPPPPAPARISITGSIRCRAAGNTCEGGECSTTGQSGCAP